MIARKQRRTRALELRAHHASYAQIARELGIGQVQAKRDVKRAIQEVGAESREDSRVLLNAQHDVDLLRLAREIAQLPESKDDPEMLFKRANALANLTRAKTRIAVAKAALNCANLEPPKQEQALNVNVQVATISIDEVFRVASKNAAAVQVVGQLPEHEHRTH